jgi:predicted aconitase
LKALGAASASSGAVGLFHAVGITPEAPTLRDALHGYEPDATIVVTPADIRDVLAHLSTAPDGTGITAVCLGTPHFSRVEWDRLIPLLRSAEPLAGIPIYVNTGRETYDGLMRDGMLAGCDDYGLKVVTDTCTYLTAILERLDGTVMTNSGKWAHYAPGNIGVQVGFGSMEDCVASAAAGRIVRLA